VNRRNVRSSTIFEVVETIPHVDDDHISCGSSNSEVSLNERRCEGHDEDVDV